MKKLTLITLIVLSLALFSGLVFAQSMQVYQEVFDVDNALYPDNDAEGDGLITFQAWIAGTFNSGGTDYDRTRYILTEVSPGSQVGMMFGRFYILVNAGNFNTAPRPDGWPAPPAWQQNEVLHIEIYREETGHIATTSFPLSAPPSMFRDQVSVPGQDNSIFLRVPPIVIFDSNRQDDENNFINRVGITGATPVAGFNPDANGVYRASHWAVGHDFSIPFSSLGFEALVFSAQVRRQFEFDEDLFDDVRGPRFVRTQYSINGGEWVSHANPDGTGEANWRWTLPENENWVNVSFDLPEACEEIAEVKVRFYVFNLVGAMNNGYLSVRNVKVTGEGEAGPPPPADPTIAAYPVPAHRATDVSIDLEVLAWSYLHDEEFAVPVGFRVYFAEDAADFADYAWVAFNAEAEGDSTYYTLDVPEELAYETEYFWKVVPTTDVPDDGRSGRLSRNVVVRNSNNIRGDAADVPVWNFTIEDTPPPPPADPTIAAYPVPAHRATDVSIDLEVLAWSYLHDEEFAVPVGFRVYFAEDAADFADFAWVAFNAEAEGDSTYYTLEVPGEIAYETEYFWKVVPTTDVPDDGRSRRLSRNVVVRHSNNIRGDAAGVPVWSFTTEEDPGVDPGYSVTIRVTGSGHTSPLLPDSVYYFAEGAVVTTTTALAGFGYEFVIWNIYHADNLLEPIDTIETARAEGLEMPPFNVVARAVFRPMEDIDDTNIEPPVDPTDPYNMGDEGDEFAIFIPGLGEVNSTMIRVIFGSNPNLDPVQLFSNPTVLGMYYRFIVEEGGVFRRGLFLRLRFAQRPNQLWIRLGAGNWVMIDEDHWTWAAPYAIVDLTELDLGAMRGDVFEFAGDDGEAGSTLPVELSSFTVNVTAQMFVELQWVTETETNMLGYKIHRSITNKRTDAELITPDVIPANNTSATTTYKFNDENVEPGNTYYYWLETVDLDLTNSFHGPVSVTLEEEEEIIPEVFVTELMQNFPNPFNPSTVIKFSLERETEVSLVVYNVLGQKVKTLANGNRDKGKYQIEWDGTDDIGRSVTSGIYFYRLSTDNYNKIHKMMLVK